MLERRYLFQQRQQQLVLYCWQKGFRDSFCWCQTVSLGLLLLSSHPLLVITRSLQLHPLIGSRQMAPFPAAVACFPPDLMVCVFVETHLPVTLALTCCTLPDSISCVAKIWLLRLQISDGNCLSRFSSYHRTKLSNAGNLSVIFAFSTSNLGVILTQQVDATLGKF